MVRGEDGQYAKRDQILLEKLQAYYWEQHSIQIERIFSGEERTTLAYAEKDFINQLAIAEGNPEMIERIERGLSAIQRVKQNYVREPQVLEKRPQITPEERDAVYERIAKYETQRTEEVNKYLEENKAMIAAGMEAYEKAAEEEPSTEDNVGVDETQLSVENDGLTPFSTEDLELTTSDVTRGEIVDAYTDVKRTVDRGEREERRSGSTNEINE